VRILNNSVRVEEELLGGEIRILSYDVVDDNGRIWPGLASKVSVPTTETRRSRHSRTFIGESAWADAQRYAEDVALAFTNSTSRR
jgi:hypothetical protein